jgi:hypothetical protein
VWGGAPDLFGCHNVPDNQIHVPIILKLYNPSHIYPDTHQNNTRIPGAEFKNPTNLPGKITFFQNFN